MTAQGASVQVKSDDGYLKMYYEKYGKHFIGNISGSAKSVLFFETQSAQDENHTLNLQLSGKGGTASANGNGRTGQDSMAFEKQILNTVELGINSVVITKPKYAEKALARLQKALDKVSEKRSEMGAVQNRLEHVVLGNQNTSENTQSAESRLRDTDMASEMVENSKLSILQQVGQSVIAQANASQEMVLQLLK